jgi:hypothetical protein
MSPSGVVMTRFVYPVPAAVNAVAVVPAPTNRSFVPVVAAEPLFAKAEEPDAEAEPSEGLAGSSPMYSKDRTSGNGTDLLNVTVTLFAPAAAALMFGA